MIDTTLLGKPVDQLTPAELAQLASQLSKITTDIMARQQTIKDTVNVEVFAKMAISTLEAAKMLGWAELPEGFIARRNEAKTGYTVDFLIKGKKAKVPGAAGTKAARTDQGLNGGDITINKIGVAMGGIAMFRAAGKDYETIKDVIKALVQPDGKPEQDRCWDISKKGISASDILTHYHAKDVSLVFADGSERTVEQSVADMKNARLAATIPAPKA